MGDPSMSGAIRRIRGPGALVIAVVVVALGGAVLARAARASGDADVTYPGAGYVGMTTGQTISLDVANEASTTCQATLEFFDMSNKLMKTVSVSIAPFNGKYMAYAPSIPVGTRMELRPVLISVGDSCTAFHASVAVSSNSNDQVRVRLQYGDPTG
jgi:hypothetical protein